VGGLGARGSGDGPAGLRPGGRRRDRRGGDAGVTERAAAGTDAASLSSVSRRTAIWHARGHPVTPPAPHAPRPPPDAARTAPCLEKTDARPYSRSDVRRE